MCFLYFSVLTILPRIQIGCEVSREGIYTVSYSKLTVQSIEPPETVPVIGNDDERCGGNVIQNFYINQRQHARLECHVTDETGKVQFTLNDSEHKGEFSFVLDNNENVFKLPIHSEGGEKIRSHLEVVRYRNVLVVRISLVLQIRCKLLLSKIIQYKFINTVLSAFIPSERERESKEKRISREKLI